MSNFLVTGGAGFIGSHIVEYLIEKKERVRVLDNFSSGRKENLEKVKDKIEIIKADIRFKEECFKACKGIDFVLHQAALRSVPKSMDSPSDYNDVNIAGTLNMLQAAKENKTKCFVFASSSSVYGDVKNFPEKESFSPHPISPYALTKLAGEYYCRIFSDHYKLKTVALRYFNVFGPRQSLDDEYAVVIPKFINCLIKGEHPPVYGSGRQSRDFTYVKNVVEANILSTKAHISKYALFNIASGKDYSVLELIKILNHLLKKNIKPDFLNKRAGDVFKTLADLSKARKLLGYSPRFDFIKGLGITIDYWKKQCVKRQ